MSVVAPSISLNAHGAYQRVSEGNKTASLYALLRDAKYSEAVKVLSQELTGAPKSRAALSLLGYAYYHMQDFPAAVRAYEMLVKAYPDVQEYKVYHAQSLHKAALYQEAAKAAALVNDVQYAHRMLQLQAAIKYEQDDIQGTKMFINKCLPDDPDTMVTQGGILFKEGEFEKARLKFQEAMNMLGYQPDVAYNIALCYYKMGQYAPALKFIVEIIDRGVREHPELCVGSNAEARVSGALEVQSVGNSQALKETALIEAYNLRAAIEYQVKNFEAAKEVLKDMPPRSEEELDPVSLHNLALMHMDTDPSGGFRKLNFLLSQPPFPPETFGNLLLLYAKYQYYDLAADVMADSVHLQETCLNEDLNEFLKATILIQASPEEAYRKFEVLTKRHIDGLRKLTKHIQDARLARDHEQVKLALKEYDDALERYVPVLMAQAKIYWDLENYEMVEKILMQSAEFLSDHNVWKLNMAHVFFMQETKFKDSIRYYEPAVRAQSENILDITAIVLANLCVSYIMTSQNEAAEALMRQIEKAEEQIIAQEPTKQCYHLCIVNLVIGTLYCAKGNFDFGILRIVKSLEPYNKKLGPDTWYYTKRCLLAVIENICKQMMVVKDELYDEILAFLDQAEEHGKKVITIINQRGQDIDPAIHNVSHEARLLKRMFLKLRE